MGGEILSADSSECEPVNMLRLPGRGAQNYLQRVSNLAINFRVCRNSGMGLSS